MPNISINGTNLHYIDKGSGKTIVMFHSTPASANFYQYQVDDLSDKYRVIAFDLRGHGDSDKPVMHYSVQRFLDDYEEIVERFGLNQFILVGCSVGGIVAQIYATRHNDRLAGLCLIGSPYSRRNRPVPAFFDDVELVGWPGVVARMVEKQFHEKTSPAVKEWAVAEYLKTPLYVRASEEIALIDEVHHPEILKNIRVPTFLACGEQEEKEIKDHMEHMANVIPQAEFHLFMNSAHHPNFEEPELFNTQFRSFLGRLGF